MKSAEIRKSLGHSVTCDLTTQSSSSGDIFYASTHTLQTSDSNLPLDTPYKSDLINQTSGTLTQSAGTHNTQTPSMTDLQSAYAHFQDGILSCSSSYPPETRIENVSLKVGNEPEEVVDHSSIVHRLDITLQGQVAEETRGLSNISSSNTGAVQRVSAPDLRFWPLPRSPVVARQNLDLNRSDPTLNKEILLTSNTVPVRQDLAENDKLKSSLNRAQSLPPTEVKVVYAGDADDLHPCRALPSYTSVTEVPMSSAPTRTSMRDKSALEGRRALSEVPLQAGRAEAWQRRSEIEPLEEEKVKKRSSLFSPRKNRKSANLSGETQQELGKHKSLWRTVFSGYKKEKKRKEVEGYSRTLPSATSMESKKRFPAFRRTSGKNLHLLHCATQM